MVNTHSISRANSKSFEGIIKVILIPFPAFFRNLMFYLIGDTTSSAKDVLTSVDKTIWLKATFHLANTIFQRINLAFSKSVNCRSLIKKISKCWSAWSDLHLQHQIHQRFHLIKLMSLIVDQTIPAALTLTTWSKVRKTLSNTVRIALVIHPSINLLLTD